MVIRCPNESCNMKMSVKNEIISKPGANVKCPACKQKFKPFDRLSKSQQDEILNKKKAEKLASSNSSAEEVTQVGNGNEKNKKALGWLVVHDENTRSQTYELYEGTQIVGRKSESRPCDIMIVTSDKFMSRNHFTIEVLVKQQKCEYVLKDYNASNRTYVETKRLSGFAKQMRSLKAEEEVYVADGDIIQAGKTKIILKTPKTVTNKKTASQVVGNQKIDKTVVV